MHKNLWTVSKEKFTGNFVDCFNLVYYVVKSVWTFQLDERLKNVGNVDAVWTVPRSATRVAPGPWMMVDSVTDIRGAIDMVRDAGKIVIKLLHFRVSVFQ